MPRKLVTECNICGDIRRETNHWLILVAEPGEFRLYTEEQWARERPLSSGPPQEICGRTCLNKALGQWVESQQQRTMARFRSERSSSSSSSPPVGIAPLSEQGPGVPATPEKGG